jgi:hypothetical protein
MANQFNAPLLQYFDSAGNPLSGGLLYIYNTGTTTLTSIYSDSLLAVPLTNPVVLNTSGFTSSDGATPCSIYWASGTAVKMKLTSSTNSSIFTIDPIGGINLNDISSFFTSADPLLTLNVDKTLNIAGGGTNFELNGVAVSTSLPDANGTPILKFTTTTNAVNQVTITDNVTGQKPSIKSSGTDATVGLLIDTKGADTLQLGTTAATTNVSAANTVNVGTSTATATNIGTVAASTLTLGGTTVTSARLDAVTTTIGNTGATAINIGRAAAAVGIIGTTTITGATSTVGSLNFAAVTVPSATSTPIGAAAGNAIDISGTTTITSFDTVAAGIIKFVRFTGALTLTYNATSLILPGSTNIVTVAGDNAEFRSLGSGNWVCTGYHRASATSILAPTQFFATMSGNQAITTGVTTKIQFNTVQVNTGNNYDAVTNFRYTAPRAGNYQINLFISIQASTSNNYSIIIFKNGSSYITTVDNGTKNTTYLCIPSVVPLAANDYLEAFVFQDSGSNKSVLSANSGFSAFLIN